MSCQTILKLPLPIIRQLPEYMTKTVPKCNFNWQKPSLGNQPGETERKSYFGVLVAKVLTSLFG